MRATICANLGCLSLMLAIAAVCESKEVKEVDTDIVLEKFTVLKDGDYLLVPVLFEGKTYHFALDTGCTCTVFDSSFPLGIPKRTVNVDTPNGRIAIPLFDAPKATVGRLELRTTGLVLGRSLATFRKFTGHSIDGFLGMDFLRQYAIRINFDRGEVLFLKKAAPTSGVKFHLSYTDWIPQVEACIHGLGKETFSLDTGSIGLESINLRSPAFHNMLEKKTLRVIGLTGCETITGNFPIRLAQGQAGMDLGPFELKHPIFCESAENHLGLAYLSRYIVTFDFPNKILYLKKGKNYLRSDTKDLSGLQIIRVVDKTQVYAVEKKSLSDQRGFKEGDVILKINDENAITFTLLQIQKTLAAPGTTVRMRVSRGNEEREISLSLEKKLYFP